MKVDLWRKARQRTFVLLLVGLFFQASLPPAAQAAPASPTSQFPAAQASPNVFNQGDVFVSDEDTSQILRVDPSTGAVVQTLDSTLGSQQGMCFDGSGHLYVTHATDNSVGQFDNAGNLLNVRFASGISASPSSCVADNSQHLYVGRLSGTNQIAEYDLNGNLLATFSPALEMQNRGPQWIDLASDQCTMFYSSSGNSIKRFNVCTNSQLADFASGLNGPCNEIRILPNGQVLAACTNNVLLLNPDGSIAHTYPGTNYNPGGILPIFSLAPGPSGASFWTAALGTGPGRDTIYHIDIATGNLIASFNLGITVSTLAILGASVSTNPSTRPIIFLHGINQNANESGVPNTTNPTNNQFVPLFDKLNPVYGGPFFQTFKYVDDRALTSAPGGCPANLFPPCQSQSAILDNAELLEKLINKLYTQTNHRVTLIGYSMGAAIIRTALAGCPDGLGNFKCADAPNMVDNVFFLNGVQQGSWLLRVKQGVDAAGALPGEYGQIANIMAQFLYNLIQIKMGLNANYPAEGDLTPGSTNINAHNSVPAPAGLHYFNFYGDIQLQLVAHIGPFLVTLSPKTPFGDLVLLRGDDNPQATPYWGGARFCLGCGNQAQFTSLNSYAEWPLTDVRQIDLFHVVRDLGNAATAPEMHTNIYSDNSLGGGIQVPDALNPTTLTTSIAQQILLDLEREDGLL